MLEALAERACVVVTDDYPAFFLPRMIASAAKRITVKMEKVDSNGLLPLRAATHAFTTAFSFRAFLQKQLRSHLPVHPKPDPLARVKLPAMESLPSEILRRWPIADDALLSRASGALDRLPIDHSVAEVDDRGGPVAASNRLAQFLSLSLENYATLANQPDEDARSGLSPYLALWPYLGSSGVSRADGPRALVARAPRHHGLWHARGLVACFTGR